jgi:uncharacterized membrane protein
VKRPSPLIAFLLLLFLAVAYILFTADSLPARVASHFVADGSANGYMPRSGYLTLMLALIVCLPLLLVLLQGVLRFIPQRFLNLPNREYWLAPERRAATLAFIQNHGVYVGILLVVFLGFVHGLVVLANNQQPPHFSVRLFTAGLLLYFLAMLVWMAAFFIHFRRRH